MENTNTIFESKDAISASEGKGFLTIDGKVIELFYCKSIEAKLTKNKQDIKVAGKRMIGKKTTSVSGEGTLTIYKITSQFDQLIVNYINTGKDVYFSLQLINEDPDTAYGRESKVLTGCNFDEANVAQWNGDDETLEQELPFTFEGIEILESFKG